MHHRSFALPTTLLLAASLLLGCTPSEEQPATDVEVPAAASTSKATPADIAGLLGHFSYKADAGRLRQCGTEEAFFVATEGDAARLERAYMETATKPLEELLVRFQGNLMWHPSGDPALAATGEKERAWYIDEFMGLEEGECP